MTRHVYSSGKISRTYPNHVFLIPLQYRKKFRFLRNLDITLQDNDCSEARGTHKHDDNEVIDIFIHLNNWNKDISDINNMEEISYYLLGVFLDEYICGSILDNHSCENCIPYSISEKILEVYNQHYDTLR